MTSASANLPAAVDRAAFQAELDALRVREKARVTTQVSELSYLHSRDITFAVFCQGPNVTYDTPPPHPTGAPSPSGRASRPGAPMI